MVESKLDEMGTVCTKHQVRIGSSATFCAATDLVSGAPGDSFGAPAANTAPVIGDKSVARGGLPGHAGRLGATQVSCIETAHVTYNVVLKKARRCIPVVFGPHNFLNTLILLKR